MYLRRIDAFFGLEGESLVALAGITGSARALQRVGEAPPIEYRKTLGERSISEYFLVPPIDSPLPQQWKALMQYKTSIVPALLRSSGGRWTFSSLDVVVETPASWFSFLDGVAVSTAKAAWSQAASFLGWMVWPMGSGGLGMANDDLHTLAWLAVPDYVEAYLESLKKRCGGTRTQGTSGFLRLVASMVREKEGYLSQQPAFLKSLPEKFHSEDWRELCKRQSAYIAKLQHAFKTELVSNRDSFEPIRSLMELPQPLKAIADMVQRMRMDRPVGCITSEAIWARDIFMVKPLISNPLRLRNMAALTWSRENVDSRKPTDRGCLYQRTDGSWWLFVPKHLLKNRRSTTLREYDSPVHQSVWGDLERYLLRHRNDLMRWPTDLVFLNLKRDPARVEPVHNGVYKTAAPTEHTPFMEMSKRLFALTRKYLWKSPGIGSHAFRHIVATSILKADGGDIKTAAIVLNDAEATVAKHYSGMRSGDDAARMGALLNKTLYRM